MTLSYARRAVSGCLCVLWPCASAAAEAGLLTAARVASPPRIDGRLDGPIYTRVAPMGGFVQSEPEDGAVTLDATYRTDVAQVDATAPGTAEPLGRRQDQSNARILG
jgi:hypothetical protein